MIEIDGITISRVLEVDIGADTMFRPVIYFYQDTRIDDCTDMSKLEKYDPQMWHTQDEDNIGIARIVLPEETAIKFQT